MAVLRESNAKSDEVAFGIQPLAFPDSIMIEKNGMRSTRPNPSTPAPRIAKNNVVYFLAPVKTAKSLRRRQNDTTAELNGFLITCGFI